MHAESHKNQPLMTWVWVRGLATKGACTACYGLVGPGTHEVQACHKDQAGATADLARKAKTGGRTSESRCRRAEQRRNASKSGSGAAFLGALSPLASSSRGWRWPTGTRPPSRQRTRPYAVWHGDSRQAHWSHRQCSRSQSPQAATMTGPAGLQVPDWMLRRRSIKFSTSE
jgi:hypothetical protein